MPINPNSALGQAQTIYGQLNKYFTDMHAYYTNGGVCPTISTYLSSIDFSALGTLTDQSQAGSANYANGAAIETTHHAMAVLREYVIRSKNKAAYYLDGSSECANESTYYDTLGTAMVSTIGGNVIQGGSL